MFGNNTLGYWPAVIVSQLVWPGLYMRRKYIFWSGSMDIFFHAPDSRYICSFSITRYGSIPWIIDNERLKIMFFLNRAELTSWAFYFTINSSASGRKNHKLWPAGPVNPTLHGGGHWVPLAVPTIRFVVVTQVSDDRHTVTVNIHIYTHLALENND